MGWRKVGKCEKRRRVDGDGIGDGEIWARGGLEDVYIHVRGVEYFLPWSVLLQLVADEWRARQLSKYEQMSDEEVVARMMGSKDDGH